MIVSFSLIFTQYTHRHKWQHYNIEINDSKTVSRGITANETYSLLNDTVYLSLRDTEKACLWPSI